MIIEHIKKGILFAFFLSFIVAVNAFAKRELNIPVYRQWQSMTCWNACCKMVFDFYGVVDANKQPLNEKTIGCWAFPPTPPATCPGTGPNVGNTLNGGGNDVEAILYHFGSLSTIYTTYNPSTGGGNISQYDIAYEIDRCRPIIPAILRSDGSAHNVLIKGYLGIGGSSASPIVCNDPFDGSRVEITYAELVNIANKQQWILTLRMKTGAPGCIINGTADFVQVGRPARPLTLTDSATYTARLVDQDRSGTEVKTWDWHLVLLHDRGEYAVGSPVSGMPGQEPSMCNWSTNIGTLPEGYNWKRDADGQIMGQVVVGCLDSDPPYYYHSAAVDVAFSDAPKINSTGEQK